MRIQSLISVVILVLAGSCAEMHMPSGGVHVRVENASNFPMNQIEVGFPDTLVSYGDLPPGSKSAYREVPAAYDIAGVTMTVGEKKLRLQPVDFVGEEPLKPGLYTYVLIVRAPTGTSDYSLTMEVRSDE